MAGGPLITLAQMERRFGPQTVSRYMDDDGDDEAESTVEEDVRLEATQVAEGLLKPGFSLAQMEEMAKTDLAFLGLMLDIAADIMARRRPENLDKDGNTPYTGIRNKAEQRLKEIAKAAARLIAEEDAGSNQKLAVRANINRRTYPLVFQPTNEDPTGPGGF